MPNFVTDFIDKQRTRRMRAGKRVGVVQGDSRTRRTRRGRKPLWIERKVRTWGGRVLGAMGEGGMGAAEEVYESHQTSQDFIWNTVGLASWGMVFPILTVVVTQLVGAEEAGKFSLAFVAGQLLMILANYGVRTYQVSDRDQKHPFSVYQVNRWITCAFMLLVGSLFCALRGYDADMTTMTMAVFFYKMIDGMADVYEGRLQQMDKLYLAGTSQTVRSIAALLVCSLFLLLTRSLATASIAMAVAALLTFIFFTLPLALLETPKSGKFDVRSLFELFVHCAPVFTALFLYAFIDNMPKFMMEGVLSYDNQLYFNALYFPAQTILMSVGFLYKPLLTRMADAWNNLERRNRFDLFILAALGAILLITVGSILFMRWFGISLLSFMYGLDFEPFRKLSYLMLLAGGITGGIDFLYQVVTVMRRQATVTKLYLVTFVFALIVPYMLINVSGLEGAVVSYVIVMAILLLLLGLEYIGVRLSISRIQEDAPTFAGAAATTETGARLGMTTREAVRQRRIAREGGEVDERFAARLRLEDRAGRKRTASSASEADGSNARARSAQRTQAQAGQASRQRTAQDTQGRASQGLPSSSSRRESAKRPTPRTGRRPSVKDK